MNSKPRAPKRDANGLTARERRRCLTALDALADMEGVVGRKAGTNGAHAVRDVCDALHRLGEGR